MRFSIVTPAYNVERHLPEMLRSVCGQTFTDWELRIVDDGSADSTADIIRETAERDPRIKPAFLTSNSGSCLRPRRLAIETSEGEYIVNIDADDFVEPDYLSKLNATIEETGADLVYSTMYLWHEGEQPRRFLPRQDLTISETESGRDLIRLALDEWEVPGVGAIDRNLALRSLKNFDSEIGADEYWHNFDNENLTRMDLFLARRVALSDAKYFYRQVEDSVTHNMSPRRFGLLASDIRLCRFTGAKFGFDSEEYILAQRQLFHHVIEFMRILRHHSSSLKNPGAEKLVRKAYKTIDFKALRGRVSPRYMALMLTGYNISKFTLGRYEGK